MILFGFLILTVGVVIGWILRGFIEHDGSGAP